MCNLDEKIDALVLFCVIRTLSVCSFDDQFSYALFFGGFCCECSTPDYITPDNQNLLIGFDFNKVM